MSEVPPIEDADPGIVAPDLLVRLTACERRRIRSKFERVLESGSSGRRFPRVSEPIAIAQYLVIEGVLEALLVPDLAVGIVLYALVVVVVPSVLTPGAVAVSVLLLSLAVGAIPTQLRRMQIRRYFKRRGSIS
ncbi:MAG: hypothetical protein JWP74_578 [Marmoricola sp.]|nr:hypothetical protein [Marmoricola sp.]